MGEPDRKPMGTKILSVELSTEEVAARAQELTAVVLDMEEARARLESLVLAAKRSKGDIEEEISELQIKANRIANAVRNKREDRAVEVFDEFDYDHYVVYTKRTDTKEVVSSRGMTDPERQRSMFKEVPPTEEASGEAPLVPIKASGSSPRD